ncbi:LOW QUALITY PROTEIN: C-C chemokine receptor type 5-like [Saccoglossus kowalevskii]
METTDNYTSCNISTDHCDFSEEIEHVHWTPNIIYYAIVVLFAVIGNLLCIATSVTIIRHRKSFPYMLICILSVSDLLMTICVHSISIASLGARQWIGGDITCGIQYSLSWAFLKFSFFYVQAQTVDRYLAINRPLLYKSDVTTRRVRIAITCFAVFSFASSIPTAIVNSGRIGLKHGWFLCLNYNTDTTDTYYAAILPLNGTLFDVALCVFLFCNIAVARILCRYRNRSYVAERSVSERRFAILIIAHSVVFFLFWVPYLNFLILSRIGVNYDVNAETVAFPLLYTNVVLNPMLYGVFKKSYRKGYWYYLHLVLFYATCCTINPLHGLRMRIVILAESNVAGVQADIVNDFRVYVQAIGSAGRQGSSLRANPANHVNRYILPRTLGNHFGFYDCTEKSREHVALETPRVVSL